METESKTNRIIRGPELGFAILKFSRDWTNLRKQKISSRKKKLLYKEQQQQRVDES